MFNSCISKNFLASIFFSCLEVGATWESNPCETCTCKNELGSVDCVIQSCAQEVCEDGFHLINVEGQCCPVCGEWNVYKCIDINDALY